MVVFLFLYGSSKILFDYSRDGILYSRRSIIFICLLKLKVALPQLIIKSPINWAIVNKLVFLAIGRIFYIIGGFYKVYIFCGIAYKAIAVIYSLVTDIFKEVYILV